MTTQGTDPAETTDAAHPAASPPAAARPGDPGAPPVVLYDGVCGLCNGMVGFTVKHDRAARYRFAALQSDFGRERLRGMGLPEDALDTVVLVKDGRGYVKSRAVLEIARGLGMPWRLAAAGAVVPSGLADGVYAWVARNRYRWFGRHDACPIPSPEVRSRFIA
ncbi:MAG: yuxK [Gemmatimonadetes bacterium]|nr:yuxK [Gemmatimonadota bacterium]